MEWIESNKESDVAEAVVFPPKRRNLCSMSKRVKEIIVGPVCFFVCVHGNVFKIICPDGQTHFTGKNAGWLLQISESDLNEDQQHLSEEKGFRQTLKFCDMSFFSQP